MTTGRGRRRHAGDIHARLHPAAVMDLGGATALAAERHAGQWYDRDEVHPYILHPLRVKGLVIGDDLKQTGVLHDIIEDTGTTAEELLALGCRPGVVRMVVALTRTNAQTPSEYYWGVVAGGAGAVTVKLADITDNSDRVRRARMRRTNPARAARLHQKDLVALTTMARYAATRPDTREVVEPCLALLARDHPAAEAALRQRLLASGFEFPPIVTPPACLRGAPARSRVL